MKDKEHQTGFVYYRQCLSPDELKKLPEKLAATPTYYFVRSPHTVSGICLKLPENFPGFEGQMFNPKLELRWKKQGDGYEALLLSQEAQNLEGEGFQPIDQINWQICDRQAYWYLNSQNQQPANFPKKFIFLDENGTEIKQPEKIQICQRYFQDSKTDTVHFIALTVKK